MIFGREPALVAGFIKAVLVVITAFWAVLTTEQIGLINAVVATALALYVAYVTDQTLASLILGLTDAVIALAIGFGASLTVEQTGGLIALVTVGIAMFNRTQVSPLERGLHSLDLRT